VSKKAVEKDIKDEPVQVKEIPILQQPSFYQNMAMNTLPISDANMKKRDTKE
jgi:hypothetical protein